MFLKDGKRKHLETHGERIHYDIPYSLLSNFTSGAWTENSTLEKSLQLLQYFMNTCLTNLNTNDPGGNLQLFIKHVFADFLISAVKQQKQQCCLVIKKRHSFHLRNEN